MNKKYDPNNWRKNFLKELSKTAYIHLNENGINSFKDTHYLFNDGFLWCKQLDLYSDPLIFAEVYHTKNHIYPIRNKTTSILISYSCVSWIETQHQFREVQTLGFGKKKKAD